MKRAITFGVFDLFHYGHLKLYQNIKKVCGLDTFLVVAVQDSEFIKKQSQMLISIIQQK
ncbi:MAG: adenylyltransferase/cytidyltransferase family protein [Alphaproteobacteria bacterium]|nr:adenylyltransferase/cytidyltransferase family protein [Alphaproteobacteria bacterium]